MSETPIDPSIALSYADEGRALLQAGQDHAALAAFERAAWMAPQDPRILWALANTLWRVGRGESAQRARPLVGAGRPQPRHDHGDLHGC